MHVHALLLQWKQLLRRLCTGQYSRISCARLSAFAHVREQQSPCSLGPLPKGGCQQLSLFLR